MNGGKNYYQKVKGGKIISKKVEGGKCDWFQKYLSYDLPNVRQSDIRLTIEVIVSSHAVNLAIYPPSTETLTFANQEVNNVDILDGDNVKSYATNPALLGKLST